MFNRTSLFRAIVLPSLIVVPCLVAGCSEQSEAPPTMTAIEEIAALEAKEREKNKMPDSYKADKLKPVDVDQLHSEEDGGSESSLPEGVPAKGTYDVKFDTDVGEFVVTVNREWAPRGAHRFYELVKDGFYNGAGFFRVVKGFMVQWGLAADPQATAKWDVNIEDDPVKQSNKRGYITFAKTGAPHSRSTQVFINYTDNAFLDGQGFAPFGRVKSGMDVVDNISAVHGEDPDQMDLRQYGHSYLKSRFPEITYIKSAEIINDDLASDAELVEEKPSDDGSADDGSAEDGE